MDDKEFYLSHQSLEKDFRLLMIALNSSKSGIILTDNQQPDNPIIFCNKAFEDISGYSRNEIIGRNCRFLQGNDRQQEARYTLRKAIDEGKSCVVQLRNFRKNGSHFWNELYMSPIMEDGRVTHFIGVQNDISERKKAESDLYTERENLEKRVNERTSNLKESEEYLKSIIETIRESLLVLDKKMIIISANDFFYKTFRVSAEETVGKSLYKLGEGHWNIPALKHILEEVLPQNNPFEGFVVEADFPVIGKKMMVLNARRIEAEGAYKDRILLAMEDLTDHYEADLRKDDFLSIASHELKTPLTTVKGYLQMVGMLLPQAASSNKLEEVLKKSDAYIDKLSHLISELLDVSKLKAGKMELHREDFDFDKMVHDCIENIQAGSQTHTIQVTGKSGLMVNGDIQRLEQVINNLLTNAIKYSPVSKEVKVYISVISEFIKVSVTDSGMGIKREDQKKIFERFYRVQSIQRDFPGMGIGLYVCDQIIKSHHGTLWVESEEGKGATFSFTLPHTQHHI